MELRASDVQSVTHPSIMVDFSNAAHMRLLDRAWHEILIREFPEPKQQESIADWAKRAQDPNVALSIPIIGENLDDPDNAILKGMAVGTFFKRSGTLLLDFTAALPEFRGQGIGQQLMLERVFNSVAHNGGKPLNGKFAEIINPDMCEGEDRVKAERRSKHFTSGGKAEVVPISYTQPGLSGYAKDDGLVLINYKLPNGQFAPPASIKGVLVDEYEHYGIAPDPDLNRMLGDLKKVYPVLGLSVA